MRLTEVISYETARGGGASIFRQEAKHVHLRGQYAHTRLLL